MTIYYIIRFTNTLLIYMDITNIKMVLKILICTYKLNKLVIEVLRGYWNHILVISKKILVIMTVFKIR